MAVLCFAASACSSRERESVRDEAAPEPEVVEWRAYCDLDDGRRFLTDGRLMLEASYVPSAVLPERKLPPERAERLLAWKTDREFLVTDLKREAPDGHYRGLDSIQLSRVYVEFLRALPLRKTLRFRAKGPDDPVLLLDGAKVVGAVMPLQE